MNSRLLLILLLTSVPAALADPGTPSFPPDLQNRREQPVTEADAFWPWQRIEQLEKRRNLLWKEISRLPQHKPQFMRSRLGYHSSFSDIITDGKDHFHEIKFSFTQSSDLHSIAIVPILDRENPKAGAYAFPKRFSIDILTPDKKEHQTVVNWLDQDFPNPGAYPVFFSDIKLHISEVRIRVPHSVTDGIPDFFALGEVYLFRNYKGTLDANMVLWDRVKVSASDTYVIQPLWNVSFLYDGMSAFGLPLTDATFDAKDLFIPSSRDNPLSDPVTITMDLGQPRHIGRIDIWPAAPPYDLALPSIGLPRQIKIEVSMEPEFKRPHPLPTKNLKSYALPDRLFTVQGNAIEARYVRITFTDLRTHKNIPMLGLGEISVSEYEKVFSIGSKVTATGIPDEYLDQLPRLVDDYSRQRRILPQGEWLKGLAQRRPLDEQISLVKQELRDARNNWSKKKLQASYWAASILALGLVTAFIIQRRQRSHSLNQLRVRITRDLHDEVGSNLGSISLSAEQLRHLAAEPEVKDELGDLSLMAREACASLREVVWVIDQGSIRLPALITKLAERAERVLTEVELSVETPDNCPDTIVSLTFKRHLIMFFKEAVHNCPRHAQAQKVTVAVECGEKEVFITVCDDGVGFDPSKSSAGWGVNNMKQRAQEMGGRMDLKSTPGEGTSIVLRLPLIALAQEPHQSYKTSN